MSKDGYPMRVSRDDTEHGVFYYSEKDVMKMLEIARIEERNACAKVCEDMAKGYEERNARPEENRDINPEVARIASMTCAFVGDAIRARGK